MISRRVFLTRNRDPIVPTMALNAHAYVLANLVRKLGNHRGNLGDQVSECRGTRKCLA